MSAQDIHNHLCVLTAQAQGAATAYGVIFSIWYRLPYNISFYKTPLDVPGFIRNLQRAKTTKSSLSGRPEESVAYEAAYTETILNFIAYLKEVDA